MLEQLDKPQVVTEESMAFAPAADHFFCQFKVAVENRSKFFVLQEGAARLLFNRLTGHHIFKGAKISVRFGDDASADGFYNGHEFLLPLNQHFSKNAFGRAALNAVNFSNGDLIQMDLYRPSANFRMGDFLRQQCREKTGVTERPVGKNGDHTMLLLFPFPGGRFK